MTNEEDETWSFTFVWPQPEGWEAAALEMFDDKLDGRDGELVNVTVTSLDEHVGVPSGSLPGFRVEGGVRPRQS